RGVTNRRDAQAYAARISARNRYLDFFPAKCRCVLQAVRNHFLHSRGRGKKRAVVDDRGKKLTSLNLFHLLKPRIRFRRREYFHCMSVYRSDQPPRVNRDEAAWNVCHKPLAESFGALGAVPFECVECGQLAFL